MLWIIHRSAIWVNPIQKTYKEYCISTWSQSSCCSGRSLVVNLGQFKGHFKFPENCSLREETLQGCFGGQDCADKKKKRIVKTQEKNVLTVLEGMRTNEVFLRKVCVKAWHRGGVAFWSSSAHVFFYAQPTHHPSYCHLAKPVSATGLRSWLSDPGADSS